MSKAELDKVMIVMFTGPKPPTPEDYRRTPLLIRPHVVHDALKWLVANHRDYKDVEISLDRLREYEANPMNPPVTVSERVTTEEGNIEYHNLPTYGDDNDLGSVDGPCPLTVAGLVGDDLSEMSKEEKIAIAIKHFNDKRAFILYGRSADPARIYRHPEYYAGMFPWLYPNGYGTFDNELQKPTVARKTHVKAALMYHDRRFQEDEYFPFLVFNQMQIQAAQRAGGLLTNKKNFDKVTDQILHVDPDALDSLVDKSQSGPAKADTPAEQAIVEITTSLDHINGHVPGSNTQRKYQRNEIRSLIYEKGAPSFFITFAPADAKSPICLFYAGKRVDLSALCPNGDTYRDRLHIVANNPVAAARFFNLMVKMFIKIILKADMNEEGLFGKTSAYYGTVESQGRLTLHLHLLLWLENADNPQIMRDKALANDEEYKTALISWLESVHSGDFLTATKGDIAIRLDAKESQLPKHTASGESSTGCEACARGDPTLRLPDKIPDFSNDTEASAWLENIFGVTDELLLLSNLHTHGLYCTRPDKSCKARFPRPEVKDSHFDSEGILHLRKTEPWLNTFCSVLTYVLRCNTDVTSLLSGTQVKAVVAYVTDYITKATVKCHAIYEAIRIVLGKNQNILDECANEREPRKEAARRLLTKIVNATIARQEMGAPMVCAHLLGHGDHYTNYKFKPFYWYSHVAPVARAWDFSLSDSAATEDSEKVILRKTKDEILPYSKVHDYIYRPQEFEGYSLYEFLRLTVVKKMSETQKRAFRKPGVVSTSDETTPTSNADPGTETSNNTQTAGNSSRIGTDHVPDVNSEALNCDDDDEADEDDDENDDNTRLISKSTCYKFTRGHPNQSTHAVFKVKPQKAFVLNFIGGSLPRMDDEYKEKYALVMISLFTPNGWRDPKLLKTETETWEETFLRTEFSTRAQRIMKNMNVLYECYESSHDYSAERRRQRTDALLADRIEKFSFGHEQEEMDEDEDDDTVFERMTRSSGKLNDKYVNTMGMMNITADEVSAILPSETAFPSTVNHGVDDELLREVRESVTPSGGWKNALKSANKSRILDQRFNRKPLEMPFSQSSQAMMPVHSTYYRPQVEIANKDSLLENVGLDNKTIFESMRPCTLELQISQDFCLNKEQKTAFTIICSHLRDTTLAMTSRTLKMYLGGIGGTGKSTVIKSVITFLEARNESHRYAVLAPTGSAACLVDGSTYHSALGLNPTEKDYNPKTLDEVRGKFAHVDLIFLDEVSMLSCEDMYCITRQFMQAFEVVIESFGGKHVVLSGDFGQLPPAGWGSTSLYSSSVSLHTLILTNDGYVKALGKSVWHQFTTVVILRENMRQRGMTEEDKMFRRCLENMRYGKCTPMDIALLESRIAGPNGPSLEDPRFKNVSIITPRNAQRDAWNAAGVVRFAKESGQQLHRFHCIDTCSNKSSLGSLSKEVKFQKKILKSSKTSNLVPIKYQRELWKLPPTLTNQMASVLDLCVGMPVILKLNEATELCATNGAEATVVNWHAELNPHGTRTLKTLFVKLNNPPRTMKLEGLPENIIPLSPCGKQTHCNMKERTVTVTRTQVSVLPNFAMSDFSAQGRTRPWNPVDLRYCRGHQSVYTCLSRSSTLEGTLILFPFNTEKITKGATGDLRREYRDLEILDHITQMRLDPEQCKDLPPIDSARYVLISWYQHKFGKRYLPAGIHPALRRREAVDADFDDLQPEVTTSELSKAYFKPKEQKESTSANTTKGPSNSGRRRGGKRGKSNKSSLVPKPSATNAKSASEITSAPENLTSVACEDTALPSKPLPPTDFSQPEHHAGAPNDHLSDSVTCDLPSRSSFSNPDEPSASPLVEQASSSADATDTQPAPLRSDASPLPTKVPLGLKWDSRNWSCAYDVLLGILWNTFSYNRHLWDNYLRTHSPLLTAVYHDFLEVNLEDPDLEFVRDTLRLSLPAGVLRWGATTTDITAVCDQLFSPDHVFTEVRYTCVSCANPGPTKQLQNAYWIATPSHADDATSADKLSVEDLLAATYSDMCSQNRICRGCSERTIVASVNWVTPPGILILELQPHPNNWANLILDPSMIITIPGTEYQYTLAGIIYLGYDHFTCRFIDNDYFVWKHDGMSQSNHMIREFGDVDLNSLDERNPCLLIFQLRDPFRPGPSA